MAAELGGVKDRGLVAAISVGERDWHVGKLPAPTNAVIRQQRISQLQVMSPGKVQVPLTHWAGLLQ